MINIGKAIEHASQQLMAFHSEGQNAPEHSDPSFSNSNAHTKARFEAELLLSHVLQKNRVYLFTYPEQLLDAAQHTLYQELIYKRIKGIPIAYLTGTKEFWSLPLNVNQHTLIPRPETERLVELVLELMPSPAPINLLDLGTGSGAIALALAKERPQWNITACDVSLDALHVAQGNAHQLGIHTIDFYHSCWFEDLPPRSYHAIVSNPPYIAECDSHLNQGDLRFEPLSALTSGQEGLDSIQYIIEHSRHHLLPNGLLLLEHGHDQKISVHAILNKIGYNNVRCWKDIQDHDRVSGGWYSSSDANRN